MQSQNLLSKTLENEKVGEMIFYCHLSKKRKGGTMCQVNAPKRQLMLPDIERGLDTVFSLKSNNKQNCAISEFAFKNFGK